MENNRQELLSHYKGVDGYEDNITIDESGDELKLHTFISVESKNSNDGDYTIVHLISTPSIDHCMDVMNPFGADLEALDKNRSVFYNHASHGGRDLPIAKNIWSKKQSNGILVKTEYAVNIIPFAKDIYTLAVNDFLNSYSIGWMPNEYAFLSVNSVAKESANTGFKIPNTSSYSGDDVVAYHKKYSIYEYSQVGVPMNMDAIKSAMAKGLITTDFGKDYFGAIVGREKLGEMVSEKTVIEKSIEQVSTRVAELETSLTDAKAVIFSLQEQNTAQGIFINKHEKFIGEIVANQKREQLKEFIADTVRGAITKK